MSVVIILVAPHGPSQVLTLDLPESQRERSTGALSGSLQPRCVHTWLCRRDFLPSVPQFAGKEKEFVDLTGKNTKGDIVKANRDGPLLSESHFSVLWLHLGLVNC